MVNPLVATLRLLALLILTLGMIPIQSVLIRLPGPWGYWFGRGYWRWVAKALGFRVRVHGAPPETGPVLVVSNHAGYLDVFVLGSVLAGAFVSKGEVADWPGVGFITKLGRTVFISRKRGDSAAEKDVVRERLDQGEILVLFPEGTSNDGNRVLPFKSTFFAVAEKPLIDKNGTAVPVPVQPVSVAYTLLDGLPMQRAFRPFYAWYGDMTLEDHIFTLLGLGNVTVDVVFHPQTSVAEHGNRKRLALACHETVERGLVNALSGRFDRM